MMRLQKELKVISKETTIQECDELNIWEKLENMLSLSSIGIGLSAIQIGYPIRAFLLIFNDKPCKYKFVNPKIIERSSGLVKIKGEGCLSFPDRYENTIRHQWVKVCDDINGEVVALAKNNNQQAPLNEKIVSLVHRVEKEGFLSENELLSEIKGVENEK